MTPRLIRLQGLRRDDPAYRGGIDEAARLLSRGGLVAFPTETVYGLGASIDHPEALRRIFTVKGRPADNPVIVHVLGVEDARRLCARWPQAADAAVAAFWPGPLTLILPRTSAVPDLVTGGLDTVAVRAPSHRVARDLVERSGPLAAPSANTSGRPSPTRAEHVLQDLGDRLDAVVDDGPCAVGVESTVLDLTGPRPVVLRPGGVAVESLREVLGQVDLPDAILKGDREDPRAARSPGTRYRHYAPGTPLVVVRLGAARDLAGAVEAVRREVRRQRAAGRRVAVLGAEEVCAAADADAAVPLGAYGEPVHAARHLFEALRRVDDLSVDVVVAHTFPTAGFGAAVTNRLLRAAAEVHAAEPRGARPARSEPPRRILLVCTGNTCRSPMAKALLQALAADRGLNVETASAGVAAVDGLPATEEAVRILAERGISLHGHRSRALRREDVEWADLILTMTRGQRDRVREEHPAAADKVFTLAGYAEGHDVDIADPVGLGEDAYRSALDRIEGYLRKAVERWRREEGA